MTCNNPHITDIEEVVRLGVKRFPSIKHGITYSGRSFENGVPDAKDVLYIGAFVTEKPQQIAGLMQFWTNKFMDHITIAYRPPQEVIDLLFKGVNDIPIKMIDAGITKEDTILIGKEMKANVFRVIHDNMACVALVTIDHPCQNAYPHITIGTAETVKPFYSNDLIQRHFNNDVDKEIFQSSMTFDVDVRIGVMLK